MSPETARFIHMRILGGLRDDDYSAWAITLIDDGHETPEIIDLAGSPGMHWQEREAVIKRIYIQIGLSKSIEVQMNNPEWLMNQWIADYQNSRISAVELVQKGYETWIKFDYGSDFADWGWLDEEISLIESGIQSPPDVLTPGYTKEELCAAMIEESGLTNKFRKDAASRHP